MDTLKGILGDDAEEKIKNVMSSLSGEGDSDNPINDLEYLNELRNIATKIGNPQNDRRSRLLTSLKPYLRENRQHSIDTAINLINVSKIATLLKK